MKKILVTGAGGLVGEAAFNVLVRHGYQVIGIGRHVPKRNIHGTSWVCLDLTSDYGHQKLNGLPELDIVIHCAAVIPNSFTDESSRKAGEINTIMDQRVIDFCMNRNVRLIFCSSSSVYGNLYEEKIINESHPVAKNTSGYVASKIASEQHILEEMVEYAIFRICAPYGSNQPTRTVLKNFIEKAVSGGVLMFHGSGSREQDFIHVNDVASVILKAVQMNKVSGIFNIASGSPISMRNLALLVAETIGNPSTIVRSSGESDAHENHRASFDIRHAETILNWKPGVSLQKGVEKWAARMGWNKR